MGQCRSTAQCARLSSQPTFSLLFFTLSRHASASQFPQKLLYQSAITNNSASAQGQCFCANSEVWVFLHPFSGLHVLDLWRFSTWLFAVFSFLLQDNISVQWWHQSRSAWPSPAYLQPVLGGYCTSPADALCNLPIWKKTKVCFLQDEFVLWSPF